jgi:hypothetical protein
MDRETTAVRADFVVADAVEPNRSAGQFSLLTGKNAGSFSFLAIIEQMST